MIRCIFEHGNVAHLRHVTVDALVVRDEKVLMVKRSSNMIVEPGKYAFPGGFLDRNEDGATAAARELLEETGYQAVSVELFKIIDSPRLKGDDRQNVGFFYAVTVGDQVADFDHEVESVHWLELAHLSESDVGFDHYAVLHEYIANPKNTSRWPLVG